jgi:hypothetical protein
MLVSLFRSGQYTVHTRVVEHRRHVALRCSEYSNRPSRSYQLSQSCTRTESPRFKNSPCCTTRTLQRFDMNNATAATQWMELPFEVAVIFFILHVIAIYALLVRKGGLPTRRRLLKIDASFSDPLPPAEVQAHGSFTITQVRRPQDLTPFEESRDKFHALWEKYIQDDLLKTNIGTECPIVGDYLGVAYPGTRPYRERIQAFTWLYTMSFLLDGKWIR